METATAAPRFRTFLLVVFAVVALMLAIAGVYGVMAYTVSQRVPEIGVRIALGASPADVMRLVLREGALLVVIGLAVGAALSFAGAQFISGLLFGVSARDPLVFVAVATLVTIAAMAACLVPGRRALRVDPLLALSEVRISDQHGGLRLLDVQIEHRPEAGAGDVADERRDQPQPAVQAA